MWLLEAVLVSNYSLCCNAVVSLGGTCNLRCAVCVEALLLKSGAMGGFIGEAGGSGCSGWR